MGRPKSRGRKRGGVATKREMLECAKKVAKEDGADGFGNAVHETVLEGHIGEHHEPELGIAWVFFEDKRKWPEGMHKLENGDRMTIFGEKDEILFDGVIEKCSDAKGRWTQQGWEWLTWAKLFLHRYYWGNNNRPLRATLIKKRS